MTKLVGILNLTPDSFSDGGKFNSLESALIQTQKMLHDGAEVIDIGAESTRPNAVAISAEDEWQRLKNILPEIVALIKNFNQGRENKVKTSIDSYHFETLEKSYNLGVDVINDVTGLSNSKIADFIAANSCETILMHHEKVAPMPNCLVNKNLNLVKEIKKWAEEKVSYLEKKGAKKSQLIFDVGIGFGKDALQSITILKNITSFQSLEMPIYVGHSKKSFLAAIDFGINFKPELSREEKTLIISQYLLQKKVDFLRVHDVSNHKKLILEKKLEL